MKLRQKIKNNKFLLFDVLVTLAILMFVLTHLFTSIILWKESTRTAADYENVVKAVEANPVAKYVLLNDKLKYVFSFVVAPATVLAIYFGIRRTKDHNLIAWHSQFIFFLSLFNVMNDAGVLIGMALR